MNKKISVFTLINNVTIAAGGSYTSPAIPMVDPDGYFSIQAEISGSGTAKLEYLVSLDDVNWLEPEGASDIADSLTAASGPGTDGKIIKSFTPVLATSMKIKATETGTSDSVTITLRMARQ